METAYISFMLVAGACILLSGNFFMIERHINRIYRRLEVIEKALREK